LQVDLAFSSSDKAGRIGSKKIHPKTQRSFFKDTANNFCSIKREGEKREEESKT
jgi:hypothetical protein